MSKRSLSHNPSQLRILQNHVETLDEIFRPMSLHHEM